jgi:hypothetical protein
MLIPTPLCSTITRMIKTPVMHMEPITWKRFDSSTIVIKLYVRAIYAHHSVQWWATGWTDGVRFPWKARNFSLFHIVQTGPGAHAASFPMGVGPLSQGVKRSGREVHHSLHLVPRSRVVELYLHSLICLHGMMLNKLSAGQISLFTFTLNCRWLLGQCLNGANTASVPVACKFGQLSVLLSRDLNNRCS